MDALTKMAVSAARESRWELLDAMELLERAKTDCTVACLAHQVGALTLIGHCEGDAVDGESEAGSDVDCTFCDGEGDLDVDGRDGRSRNVTCPVCEGHGLVDRDDVELTNSDDRGDVTHWRRLDGQVVDFGDTNALFICTMTIAKAHGIVKRAKKALAEAEEGAGG